MPYVMERIAILNPDTPEKIVIFRHFSNKNKFTYRTFPKGRAKDKEEILPKVEAEALCQICGVEY